MMYEVYPFVRFWRSSLVCDAHYLQVASDIFEVDNDTNAEPTAATQYRLVAVKEANEPPLCEGRVNVFRIALCM